MSKQTQRSAVYNAVINQFAEVGIHFEDGMNASEYLTKDYRSNIHEIVCEGFRSGSVEFEDTASNKQKLADSSKLSSYVSGLISNWLRKDTRLNGGGKYVAKNPGSRAGQGDEQMKTLRALSKQFAGTDKESFINEQIEQRKAQIASTKTTSVVLTEEMLSKLDPAVREALGV